MSEAKEVGVKFKKTFNLSVAKTGSGLGVVDNTSNGVTCTNRCTTTTIPFPQGATTTLYTVVPNKEFYFKEFTGGTGSATVCDGTTECTLTVGEDSSVEAKFDRRPEATLTITKEGGGQAKISGPHLLQRKLFHQLGQLLLRAAHGKGSAGLLGPLRRHQLDRMDHRRGHLHRQTRKRHRQLQSDDV